MLALRQRQLRRYAYQPKVKQPSVAAVGRSSNTPQNRQNRRPSQLSSSTTAIEESRSRKKPYSFTNSKQPQQQSKVGKNNIIGDGKISSSSSSLLPSYSKNGGDGGSGIVVPQMRNQAVQTVTIEVESKNAQTNLSEFPIKQSASLTNTTTTQQLGIPSPPPPPPPPMPTLAQLNNPRQKNISTTNDDSTPTANKIKKPIVPMSNLVVPDLNQILEARSKLRSASNKNIPIQNKNDNFQQAMLSAVYNDNN